VKGTGTSQVIGDRKGENESCDAPVTCGLSPDNGYLSPELL